jgi:hypothetical protein
MNIMATATVKYYSGEKELKEIWPVRIPEFVSLFPFVDIKKHKKSSIKKGLWYDDFSVLVGMDEDGETLPITRKVAYKKNPSLHKCDGRCRSAKGHSCECSCGGKNHGING